MTGSNRGLRKLAGLVVTFSLALNLAASPQPASAADPILTAWNGGIDLYRAGTFTTQKDWLWCTAAGVQIVRNIVDGQTDHSASGQRRYFTWMREHNRYTLPVSAGVDPQGWTAGLRHFVDDRYRLVASTTFDFALRSAVKRLRLTNLPVALTVANGNHGWILTGFTATADPSTTSSFKVTSVRVVGPLHGLQSRNGYDMPPDTKLTPTQLKRYFTPWKYAPQRMVWDGRYVSIQPVPDPSAPRLPLSPGQQSLSDLLALLRVAGEDRTGYARSLFTHWIDADGDGCDTRRQVLIDEAVSPPTVGAGCSFSGGRWVSLYDGIETTVPGTFDVDHVVPLAEAWDSGASAWSADRRTRFANDLVVDWGLIAVSASSNRSKGDQDPAEWLPPLLGVRCQYLAMWLAVKVRWSLAVDTGEAVALGADIAGCPQLMVVPPAP